LSLLTNKNKRKIYILGIIYCLVITQLGHCGGIKIINDVKLRSIDLLNSLRHRSGLFGASTLSCQTGYDKAWIRDNIYIALGIETFDIEAAIRVYHALFDILLKHEYKIDWAIREKPDTRFKYIHARFNPITLDEFHDEWGNKQNDAIGAFLFKVGELENRGIKVIRSEADLRILLKLVLYLESIEYWHDNDNGVWEENEEAHASSIGACVAGLRSISSIIPVPEKLIKKGEDVLNALLPSESVTRQADLALLSLIYPYNVVSGARRSAILANVERLLVRDHGVIRYVGDQYYANEHGEAEWTMGFPWLAIIFKTLGNKEKYDYYVQKTMMVMNENGELPELYFAGTDEHNENSPLGWAQAMCMVAISESQEIT